MSLLEPAAVLRELSTTSGLISAAHAISTVIAVLGLSPTSVDHALLDLYFKRVMDVCAMLINSRKEKECAY
jgi:hypothetical protein